MMIYLLNFHILKILSMIWKKVCIISPNFSTILRVRRKIDNLNQIVDYEDTPQMCRKYTPQSTASLGTQSILILFSDQ